MEVGEAKQVTVAPEEGYGQVDPDGLHRGSAQRAAGGRPEARDNPDGPGRPGPHPAACSCTRSRATRRPSTSTTRWRARR